MPGRLQSMFGGTSANAYMLVYRQRKISRPEAGRPKVPDYWTEAVAEMNAKEEKQREEYESMKN